MEELVLLEHLARLEDPIDPLEVNLGHFRREQVYLLLAYDIGVA